LVVITLAGIEVVAEEGRFGGDFALPGVDERKIGGGELRGGMVLELKVFRVGGRRSVGWAEILGDGGADYDGERNNPKGAGC
jgi:hypothetical protein